MPVLKIYKTNKDEKPVAIFSGAEWIWESDKNIITVWFRDTIFDFTCTELKNNELVFSAYGKIIPEEENDELFGF